MATAHSSLEHAEVRLVDATKDESSRLAPPGPERALIKNDLMHTWLGDDALPLRGVERSTICRVLEAPRNTKMQAEVHEPERQLHELIPNAQ